MKLLIATCIFFVGLSLILIGGSGATFAQDNDANRGVLIDTFATLKPSVGALYALEARGDLEFLCSATAVGREGDATIILTAYHCVQKGVSYLINFGDNQFRPLRVWQVPHYELGGDEWRAYDEPKTDMALFLMDGVDVPILPLAADSSMLLAGELLAMVGFPLGLAKISYQGTLAGYYDRPGTDEHDYLLMQIFGAPGSSGSAVVLVETGEVVGVLVQAQSARIGLPVIFATPIDYQRYLKKVPTGATVSEEDETVAPDVTDPRNRE